MYHEQCIEERRNEYDGSRKNHGRTYTGSRSDHSKLNVSELFETDSEYYTVNDISSNSQYNNTDLFWRIWPFKCRKSGQCKIFKETPYLMAAIYLSQNDFFSFRWQNPYESYYYDHAIDIIISERITKHLLWKYRNNKYNLKLIERNGVLNYYSQYETTSTNSNTFYLYDKHDLLQQIDLKIRYKTLNELKKLLCKQILTKRQHASELGNAINNGQFGDILSIVF
eukprot:177695_1